MATWQYQCVSCGGLHDAPLRPEGSVYLRCAVTHEWAWHDPSRFVTAAPPATAFLAKAGKGRAARSAPRRASSARARIRKPASRRAVRPRRRKPASRRTTRTSRGRS